MKKGELNRSEKQIEKALLDGEFRPLKESDLKKIAEAVARRKKDAVLNIRVNKQDLEGIKRKAKRLGIPYQTFVSEIIHHYAS
ncbi:MAG: hypothetical protein COB53_03640 [Elusimicrobia bacterium]|nr:MAG: hypothetical protein COB53_03640 [Elusimicrobiota bacterium]